MSQTTPANPKTGNDYCFVVDFKSVTNGLVVTVNNEVSVAKNVDEALNIVRMQMYQKLSLTEKETT